MRAAESFADSRVTTPSIDVDFAEALARLENWQVAATELSFLYARSKGGLIHAGRGLIAGCSADVIQVDTISGSMVVAVTAAKFSTAPQLFFTADFASANYVDGVSIHLGNCDLLFFSGEASPERLAAIGSVRALR